MRCKPGDLARVIKDDDFHENVGKWVFVVGKADPDEFENPAPTEWECEPLQPLRMWVHPDDVEEDGLMDYCTEPVSIDDEDLQPVGGGCSMWMTGLKETVR